MKNSKLSRIYYLSFTVPFILAFLSWLYFPTIANWIITNVFGYIATKEATNIIWALIIRFFYTWYTFVAIGIAGTWIVAASFARKRHVKSKHVFYPMVSFVVPAYNQEKNIAGCAASLFKCAENYNGNCEIIIIDDGSNDYTYEVACSAVKLERRVNPRVRARIVRHSANLGKIEALRTGVNSALGGLVADSEWSPDTLSMLVNYKMSNGKCAVTGYAHPNFEGSKANLIVNLQRLEYSQGLSVGRCAQSINSKVLVVSGAIGVYDADLLREVLMERNIRSVTEDLEITLEMHKKNKKVGYVSSVQSTTIVPISLGSLWRQRLRWFTGWLDNTLGISRDLMSKRSWLSALLWYSYIFEYGGAFVDLASVTAFPLLWWFAPDQALFGLNLLVFLPYGLLIGTISQAIALKFAYGSHIYQMLLLYTPFYPLLRLLNVLARSRSVLSYLTGSSGEWHS
jgi:cellulose synthase/poly-beta-1,6-N-acetylglucosamine synthase-like glycosyltransferase